jgi:hypothetical protein
MAYVGKKVYGQSKDNLCAFCDNRASTENSQGMMVCRDHKDKLMEETKCVCGEWLDIKKSKWGAFYVCSNCGPMNMKKGNDMKSDTAQDSGFKLNKKYQDKKDEEKEKNIKYEEDMIYTLGELESIWD